ncbi:hypothetical protein ACS2TZ_48610, partial [Bacillus cereus group sp. Bce025]
TYLHKLLKFLPLWHPPLTINDSHSHYINNENQFQLYFLFLFIPYKKAQMTIQSSVLFITF